MRTKKYDLTDSFLRDFIDYKNNHSIAETAAFYGVSNHTVYRWTEVACEERGIASPKKEKYSEDFIREVEEFFKTHTIRETAEKFSITPRAVRYIRHMDLESGKTQPKNSLDKIAQMKEFAEKCKGHTYEEVSKMYSITEEQATNRVEYLKKKGINVNIRKKKSGRKSLSDEFLREIAEYYENHTSNETAEKYHVRSQLVREWLGKARARGIPVRTRQVLTDEFLEEIGEYSRDHSMSDIMEKYHTSWTKAYYWVRKAREREAEQDPIQEENG